MRDMVNSFEVGTGRSRAVGPGCHRLEFTLVKTATTALTAAVLVTGIGLAVAQTAEPAQPAAARFTA